MGCLCKTLRWKDPEAGENMEKKSGQARSFGGSLGYGTMGMLNLNKHHFTPTRGDRSQLGAHLGEGGKYTIKNGEQLVGYGYNLT